MSKTIFQRIIDKEVPARVVYEDDLCLAFHDVNPQAPVHVLVIPKRPVRSVADLAAEDQGLAGHLLLACRRIAEDLKLDGGYRIVANIGPDAGQTVDHLHLHILAGRALSWPPG